MDHFTAAKSFGGREREKGKGRTEFVTFPVVAKRPTTCKAARLLDFPLPSLTDPCSLCGGRQRKCFREVDLQSKFNSQAF